MVLKILGGMMISLMLFVGMVHGVLMVKGTHTTESMGTFHDWPVIGGFFPKFVPTEPPPTPEQMRDRQAAIWLEQSRRDFELPAPYTADQMKTLVFELKDARARVEGMENRLQDERAAIERAKVEIEAQRQEIARTAEQLDAGVRNLEASREELDRERVYVHEEELKSFKTLAGIYEAMTPDDAATKLKDLDEDTAAKLLSRMTDRKAGKILGVMKPANAVAITKKLQALTVSDGRRPESRPAGK